jgi:hypothetical protein
MSSVVRALYTLNILLVVAAFCACSFVVLLFDFSSAGDMIPFQPRVFSLLALTYTRYALKLANRFRLAPIAHLVVLY